jgi:diguanylate cyclase (GGDEF)-like protein
MKFNFRRIKTCVIAATSYVVLLAIGVAIAWLYHGVMVDSQKNYAELARIHAKSDALEGMLSIARERSILLAQAIFTADPFERDALRTQFDKLIPRFNEIRSNYVQHIRQSINEGAQQAIAHQELAVMDVYLDALNRARAFQDQLSTEIETGNLLEIGEKWAKIAIPQQNEAMRILSELKDLNTQDRKAVEALFERQLLVGNQMLRSSSLIYLIAWLIIGAVSLRLLTNARNAQELFENQLENEVLQRTKAYEEVNQVLERTANYDAVTGLLNRHSFQLYLQRLVSQQDQAFSLFFIDLDNFKWFNDTLGHEAGDALLRHLSEAFLGVLSHIPHTYLARIGGDEFVVICPCQDADAERLIAQQLIDIVNKHNKVGASTKALGCSIGIARFPDHGTTKTELLRFADFAMYCAKAAGKNQVCVFSDVMKQDMQSRLMLEEALSAAIKNKALTVHYQAQFDMKTLEVIGAEALTRWQHEGQLISPAIFVPLAEKVGFIYDLGLFVFEASVRQLAIWRDQGHSISRMAINLSQMQLCFPSLISDFMSIIRAYDVDAKQLDLEITESTFMEESGTSLHVLNLLQASGIEISIDDFGTGYSSLSQIKRLNVDRIKIDKSFVDDIATDGQSQTLVKAIITMAHSLGLRVLAEGIETEAQYQLLKALGCDEGQGYWFARPVPAEQFSFATKTITPEQITIAY